jgi:hypothetical protein
MFNTNANIKAAEEMGRSSFRSGSRCASVLDVSFMSMIRGRQPGDKRTAKEMKAWIRGWTKESLK